METPEPQEVNPFSWRKMLTPEIEVGFPTPPSSEKVPTSLTIYYDRTTPRSSRAQLAISALPKELSQKCAIGIFKDTTPPIVEANEEATSVFNRSSCDIRNTPKKKKKLTLSTPKKLFGNICLHQKENSPIKIDCATQEWSNKAISICPLVLKPPPRRLSTLCSENPSQPKDILTGLANKNMYRVIQQILGYLPVLDVVSVSQVSRSWSRICRGVMNGELTEGKHLALTSKENICGSVTSEVVIKARTRTPFKTYPVVLNTNMNPSPKRRIPDSPQLSPKSKRFCHYVKEGKCLEKSERLTKCTKCFYPAKYSADSLEAECSSCSHRFCSQCRCSPHPSKKCSFVLSLSPSPKKTYNKIGSKASKKALRRLLC